MDYRALKKVGCNFLPEKNSSICLIIIAKAVKVLS